MVHLYCGDGKGKTTAAAGLAVRAAGDGFKVIFAQFMKGSESGEVKVLDRLDNVEVMRAEAQDKFTFNMNEEERRLAVKENGNLLRRVEERAVEAKPFLLVLDEAVSAVYNDMITDEDLRGFIGRNRDDYEIVITGSTPEVWMIDIADYVTDLQKIKHPFDNGLEARKGIEY
ncbi:MAG: cob(I)yrinic acid a,c-diamide adenosyltransferase [Clostridia bacterium]|nr:cob(I)yrinic acid a,c-diamide adenosyltransferase [Clostridia bacterium]